MSRRRAGTTVAVRHSLDRRGEDSGRACSQRRPCCTLAPVLHRPSWSWWVGCYRLQALGSADAVRELRLRRCTERPLMGLSLLSWPSALKLMRLHAVCPPPAVISARAARWRLRKGSWAVSLVLTQHLRMLMVMMMTSNGEHPGACTLLVPPTTRRRRTHSCAQRLVAAARLERALL